MATNKHTKHQANERTSERVSERKNIVLYDSQCLAYDLVCMHGCISWKDGVAITILTHCVSAFSVRANYHAVENDLLSLHCSSPYLNVCNKNWKQKFCFDSFSPTRHPGRPSRPTTPLFFSPHSEKFCDSFVRVSSWLMLCTAHTTHEHFPYQCHTIYSIWSLIQLTDARMFTIFFIFICIATRTVR